MDIHPQPNQQPSVPPERVEITDYPGTAAMPPLATLPPQREVKQAEDDPPRQPSGGSHSPIGWLDRRIPHFAFAIEVDKLVLTRGKWWSILGRGGLLVWGATWILISSQHTTSFTDGIFRILIPLGWVVVFVIYLIGVISLVRGKGDQLIFDRAASSFSRSQYPNIKTPLNTIREVNVDQQSNQYRVALLHMGASKTPIDTWYNEAEAVYAAGVIADYLGVPLTRTESPATITQGCVVTIAVFILIFISVGIALWVGSAIFH